MGQCCLTPYERTKDIEVTGAESEAFKSVLQDGGQYITSEHRTVRFDYTDPFTVRVEDDEQKAIFEIRSSNIHGQLHKALFKADDLTTPLCYLKWSVGGHLCVQRFSEALGTYEEHTVATLTYNALSPSIGQTYKVYIHQEPLLAIKPEHLKDQVPDLTIAAHACGTGIAYMRQGVKLADFSGTDKLKDWQLADWKLEVGPNVDIAFLAIVTEAVRSKLYDEVMNDSYVP